MRSRARSIACRPGLQAARSGVAITELAADLAHRTRRVADGAGVRLYRAVVGAGECCLSARHLGLVHLNAAKGCVTVAHTLRTRGKLQQTAHLQDRNEVGTSRFVCLNT